MSAHEQSASIVNPASTLLPRAKIIELPKARRSATEPGTFTKSVVRRMQCPPGQTEKFFWDAACRGFGIRSLRSGRRSWVYQYRDEHGRTRRIVLGDVSAVTLEDAREEARRKAASVAHGANPAVERKAKRNAGTLLEVIDAYLPYAKMRQRPRSYRETERHLRGHAAPIHHDRLEGLHRRDIAALLERIAVSSGRIAANRVRAALSAMWSWGLRTGRIEADSNPVAFTIRQPEKARERVLTDAELEAVWAATDDGGDYSRIVRLCLLTGCRREEIGGLRWDEVKGDWIVFAADRMKGKIAHEIALLPMIEAALPERPENEQGSVFGKRGTGFSGFSDGKEKLDAKLAESGIQMAPWGLHDLRRTFSTRLHDAGVEPLVMEALLAHKQQGVAAVYNRGSFREAKRAALTRWHTMVRETTSTLGVSYPVHFRSIGMGAKDMTGQLDKKRLAAFIKEHSVPRPRARPGDGFGKALKYSDEFWELRREGMSPWRAKEEVARRNRKRPNTSLPVSRWSMKLRLTNIWSRIVSTSFWGLILPKRQREFILDGTDFILYCGFLLVRYLLIMQQEENMRDTSSQEILSEREVSDWLGVSEPTLFRHRRDGTGPKFIQLSARRIAYRRSAIEAWLKEHER